MLHYLGVGVAFGNRKVIMIIDETEVCIINQVTGEVISTHLINPAKNYWAKIS